MKSLTPRQSEILTLIRRSIESTGQAPTIRELRDGIGVAATHGIEKHIQALVRKGAVVKHGDQTRGLSLPAP